MQCPLLCKEFIVEAWQLFYARTKGADAVLLIASVLTDLDIKYMTKICKILGLAALVEVIFLFLIFTFDKKKDYIILTVGKKEEQTMKNTMSSVF